MFKLMVLIILLTSCSKFKLVNIKSNDFKRMVNSPDNSRPNFYVLDYTPDKKNRKIAATDEAENTLTNKQVYFLTLLQQYLTFNSIIGKSEKDFSCPKFHNDLLNYRSLITIQKNHYSLEHNYTTVLNDERLLPSFPIMALPYNEDVDLYSYFKNSDENVKEHIQYALEIYNNKNFIEINELCEQGTSDGYYIYENLVNFHSSSNDKDNLTLEAILNIPVIANMLVIDSLKLNNNDALNIINEKILNRSRLGWFKNYLYELRKIRNNESKYSTHRSPANEELNSIVTNSTKL